MGSDLSVFIGFDSREAVASEVAAHSILRRTKSNITIHHLKHRDLRKRGLFTRAWATIGATGEWVDLNDGRPFSTEFSHTRFLVPKLMGYKGWALFLDADMIFLTDIAKLLPLLDDTKAVMVVKHNQVVQRDAVKMDGRQQLSYRRKNWSSFVLWNCAHPANAMLTEDKVNTMLGSDMHAFSWLPDVLIGELPYTYNYISGVSPKLPPESGYRPDVVHYTEGGPWFENCREVPYASMWMEEYEDWQRTGGELGY